MAVWMILPTLLTLFVAGYVVLCYLEDKDHHEFFFPSKPYPLEKAKSAAAAVLFASVLTLGLPVLSVWLSRHFG